MNSEMDELVQKLNSAAVSDCKTEGEERNNENRGNGYQNYRRRQILDAQRYDNEHIINKSRVILNLVEAMEKEMLPTNTKREKWRPSVFLPGFEQPVDYSNILSNAEWMLELPEDFSESWLMVVCPKAMRMLVVAYNGITRCFDKFGFFRFERSTALPGGNYRDMIENAKSCVLDCFYHKEQRTMFVVDILSLNNHMMTYAEAGGRQYWLETIVGTSGKLSQHTEVNHMIFKILPKLPCTTESLKECLSVFPHFDNNKPYVDGLLFYHSRAKYYSGETPMVNWSYPYMLSELLGEDLKINKAYLLEKPVDYVNYMQFITKFEARPRRKRQRRFLGLFEADEIKKNNHGAAAQAVCTTDDTDEAEAQRLDIAAGPEPVATDYTKTAQSPGVSKSTEMKNVDYLVNWAKGDYASSSQELNFFGSHGSTN